jgi:hypothetical protein
MVYIGNDRQKLYEALRSVKDEISLKDLAKKLKWTDQQLLDVMCPIGKELKESNALMLMGKQLPDIFNENASEEFLKDYFRNSLVDLALLQEGKVSELRNRPSFDTPINQAYRALWKKYRGY